MSVMLQQLENNEAVLLMYIAGELPEEERREVAAMLKTDSRLREMHEALRGAWDGTMAGVEQLDASEPAAFSRDAAARQVGRMVRQWHAARLAPKPVSAPPPRYRWPWWAIASSTIAASVIGFLVWWGQFNEERVQSMAATVPGGDQLVDSRTDPATAGNGPQDPQPGGDGAGQTGGAAAASAGRPGSGSSERSTASGTDDSRRATTPDGVTIYPRPPTMGYGGYGGYGRILSPEDWERRAYPDPTRMIWRELSSLESEVAAVERLAGDETP